MTVYYNEIDPYAAQWLRNLIAAGHIAPGVVDERSVEDVQPWELWGFTQCHFFAGIGGWSYALRLAGWPDDREVWTGSCPCQPFSAAGKGAGFADERHLWPAWHHLIRECKPAVVFGEQVASAGGLAWLDVVCADMEAETYAIAAADLCAAGVGAPHIRQRLYFVAHASGARTGRDARATSSAETSSSGSWRSDGIDGGDALIAGGATGFVADSQLPERWAGHQRGTVDDRQAGRWDESSNWIGERGDVGALADDDDSAGQSKQRQHQLREDGNAQPGSDANGCGADDLNFWADADWLPCRDGKARPVEPGSFPLAYGIPNRVGRLRAYGNAIVAPLAAAFIEACLEC